MSIININNLTFSYEGSENYVFRNVDLNLDTNWKLGLVGRNGIGKTTFLNLLLDKYEYSGSINADVNFEYFPFNIENKKLNSYEIAKMYLNHDYEQWKLEKEINLLNVNSKILLNPFNILSMGEQTKVLLAILFLKVNSFLLIDEPTNHLDLKGRETVANYLKLKRGFIIVSHDRELLDTCIDHVLYINKSTIGIEKGNFSSYFKNKTEKDNFELNEKKKKKNEIVQLEKNSNEVKKWANKVENSKYNIKKGVATDKGYIGHKSAKMMKRAIIAQKRKEKKIAQKSNLLKDIDVIEDIKIQPLNNIKGRLLEFYNFSVVFNNRKIFKETNFYIENKDRVRLKGPNGCGKSSLLKAILGEDIQYVGKKYSSSNLRFSYVPQNIHGLSGKLDVYAKINKIDESTFKTVLIKLGFNRNQLDKDIKSFSNGQKKKVLITKSLCEEANIYVWDEPLNYIDVFSRMQLENLLLKCKLTMIFVEHDEVFSEKIATKVIDL